MSRIGPRTVEQAKDCPTGNALVLLRDVPENERLTAYSYLVRSGDLEPEEAQRLLAVALNPGDIGGRIAA